MSSLNSGKSAKSTQDVSSTSSFSFNEVLPNNPDMSVTWEVSHVEMCGKRVSPPHQRLAQTRSVSFVRGSTMGGLACCESG